MRMIRFFNLALLLAVIASMATWPAAARPGQSFEEARNHWAYQPIGRPQVPKVRAAELVQSPIDAFLLARLEAAGLSLAPRAKPRTLLRRIYYDLIGVPPTFEEIEAFEKDSSPRAVAAVVDRLLADARYGERWARHWLDVARYADTKDLVLLYGKDALRPFAYTYRDYVIRAFNEDIPYNEFVRDQVAADVVEPALPPWRLAALGFLTLGRLFDENRHDQIDDQIDTVTRGFMGLTVACARCHDHKYDAITMDDYYGLYGVFASTERPYLPPLIEDPESVPQGPEFEGKLAKAVQTLEDHIDAQYEALTETLRGRVGDYLFRAATTKPDITETTQFALSLTPDDYRPSLMLRARRLLDQRLKPSDPVFGTWAELIDLPDEDFASRAPEILARAEAESRTRGGGRNSLVISRFRQEQLASKEDVARAFSNLLKEHYRKQRSLPCPAEAFFESRDEEEITALITGEESPIWFAWRDTPDHMSRPHKDRYNSLVLQLDKLAAHAEKAPPARAMVVRDLPTPYSARVFARGNPSRAGREVPRASIRVLTDGEAKPFATGSGRLGLAESIVSPANPLTARVFVNRVWMQHFGEPLVASTADFGVRSEPPTHPELLDWLAREFIDSGWRLKHLHRVILLSSVYQQATADHAFTTAQISSSTSSPQGLVESEIGASPNVADASPDPDNKLLSHFRRRRLDLEAMRDSLLFISGRIDPTMGGRPVDVGDALNRRRTLYGLVDRQNLPSLYRAFDFAVPDQCVERRPLTTVPQQALFAMNSPFVIEQAKAVVALPEIPDKTDPQRRVDSLFRRILARPATAREKEMAVRFIENAAVDAEAKLGAWEQLAQVLLVSNEAVFLD